MRGDCLAVTLTPIYWGKGLKEDFPERNGVLRTGGGRNLAANILEIDMGISIDEEHTN
jgi:hypothetical protein